MATRLSRLKRKVGRPIYCSQTLVAHKLTKAHNFSKIVVWFFSQSNYF
jgi:hypothetical protein